MIQLQIILKNQLGEILKALPISLMGKGLTTFASISIPQPIYTHHLSLLQMTIHEF